MYSGIGSGHGFPTWRQRHNTGNRLDKSWTFIELTYLTVESRVANECQVPSYTRRVSKTPSMDVVSVQYINLINLHNSVLNPTGGLQTLDAQHVQC